MVIQLKINYPISKRKSNDKIINFGNRGMSLESDLNDTNTYYLEKDIAVIYKKPTPIGIVKTSGVKIIEAYFKQPSTTDYNGLYQGNYIDFEAKETASKTSFSLENIHKHQLKHMEKVINHGGIAFIIVRFTKLEKTFLLFYQDLLEYIESNKKKSISINYFMEKGYLLKYHLNPKIDYIEIVNKYGGLK